MHVTVVTDSWETYRDTLRAVVDAALAHCWVLTVHTELTAVPAWARYNYTPYDATQPLALCDLLIWLRADPPPAVAPWLLTSTPLPPVRVSRWVGVPASATWECTERTSHGVQCLVVPDPARFFQDLTKGVGKWPRDAWWTGDVLPGRLCPAAWWGHATWAVHDGIGVEYIAPR